MKMTTEHLAGLFAELQGRVTAGDSFEGHIIYSRTEPGLAEGEWEVSGRYRIGDAEGQSQARPAPPRSPAGCAPSRTWATSSPAASPRGPAPGFCRCNLCDLRSAVSVSAPDRQVVGCRSSMLRTVVACYSPPRAFSASAMSCSVMRPCCPSGCLSAGERHGRR